MWAAILTVHPCRAHPVPSFIVASMQRLAAHHKANGQLASTPCHSLRFRTSRAFCTTKAGRKDDTTTSTNTNNDTGIGLKAVWYAAEAFGKAIGGSGSQAKTPVGSKPSQVMSREQILAAIKEDYSQNYFVSGLGDMAAYADDCVFADPFVSFKGTDRFKQNVGNLGGLMRNIKLDVYEFQEDGPDKLQTKWRFSCVLDLPWKPLLAAAGGTTHVIDLQSGQVVKHIEMWDVEPGKVVRQLFRPASQIPTNSWETFMLSASNGDGQGMWLATSSLFVKLTAPVVAVSIVTKVVTGEGLPGVALGALEGISWLLLVSALVTEAYKLVGGSGGGESGGGL